MADKNVFDLQCIEISSIFASVSRYGWTVMQIRIGARRGVCRCSDKEHKIANALLFNGAFLQGSYCGSLPPDSDEEYVKYRIKIWTVVGRKRI